MIWEELILKYLKVLLLWTDSEIRQEVCNCRHGSHARCFASFQTLLTQSKILEKAFAYKYLHPWLGQGLLTATGMFVGI